MNTDELASSLRCTEMLKDSPSPPHRVYQRAEYRSRRVHHQTQQSRSALQPVSNNNTNRRYSNTTVISRKRVSIESRLNSAQHQTVNTLTDRTIGTDPRVLENLKASEIALCINSHYFSSIQEHVLPQHREQAVDWLYDVAKEERCEPDIFPLAVSLFDRFLSQANIYKESIQVLASVCLFIASKIKAPQPLNAQKMSYYTADSVSASDILQWELIVLTQLGWDLNIPTAFDFFDQMVSRLQSLLLIKKEFATVVHKIQKNTKLGMLVPSIQCALALLFTAERYDSILLMDLESILPFTLNIDADVLRGQMPQVLRAVSDGALPPPAPIAPPSSCRTPSPQLVALKPSVPATPLNDSGFCSGVSSPESVGAEIVECSPPKLARFTVA